MIWCGRMKKQSSDIHWDTTVLTSCLTSCYFRNCMRDHLLSLSKKQSIDWDIWGEGISPLCILWITQYNMHGCHTLVCLTFLYLTVKNSPPPSSIYSQPLSLQLPCSNLASSPQPSAIPRRIGRLSSRAAITTPISLKQKLWCWILENVKLRLYFT